MSDKEPLRTEHDLVDLAKAKHEFEEKKAIGRVDGYEIELSAHLAGSLYDRTPWLTLDLIDVEDNKATTKGWEHDTVLELEREFDRHVERWNLERVEMFEWEKKEETSDSLLSRLFSSGSTD